MNAMPAPMIIAIVLLTVLNLLFFAGTMLAPSDTKKKKKIITIVDALDGAKARPIDFPEVALANDLADDTEGATAVEGMAVITLLLSMSPEEADTALTEADNATIRRMTEALMVLSGVVSATASSALGYIVSARPEVAEEMAKDNPALRGLLRIRKLAMIRKEQAEAEARMLPANSTTSSGEQDLPMLKPKEAVLVTTPNTAKLVH